MPTKQSDVAEDRPPVTTTTSADALAGRSADLPDASTAPAALTALGAAALLAACGGADSLYDRSGQVGVAMVAGLPGAGGTEPAKTSVSATDAARFLSQATFGPRSVGDIEALQAEGLEHWLWRQFSAPTQSHVSYLAWRRQSRSDRRVTQDMSYEAIWQQFLHGEDQLRARVAFALSQIVVISNSAGDLRPHGMSSYWDMLNRHAFGNFRDLLEAVTLHPAMGYFLNMLGSQKENPATGTHPNENYAREILQLFSIGMVRLRPDGTPETDTAGQAMATYDETVVKGYAQAFTGWGLGDEDNTNPDRLRRGDENKESNWVLPMKPWSVWHSSGEKRLLDGRVLPAGQTIEQDMKDALDSIFAHPNVGPFIGKQLIQRLVTSNPSPAYVARISAVFADNGAGVRGDLRAVVRAILLDPEARGDAPAPTVAKQREPVIRFAQFLRALGAKSRNGANPIHELDSSDNGLGQSPLLAPTVFNFFLPAFKPAGALERAGLAAPEFQITTETTVVASLNFFASLFERKGYGWDQSRLELDYAPLMAMADNARALASHLDRLFFHGRMSIATHERLVRVIESVDPSRRERRVKSALIITALSPDFVIQK
jgi:uncharacterized protein (DUF1800 family)